MLPADQLVKYFTLVTEVGYVFTIGCSLVLFLR